METYSPSDKLTYNLINIIDKDSHIDDNLDVREKIIAHVTYYVKSLYDEEKDIMRDLND